jgi:hypothetical protein
MRILRASLDNAISGARSVPESERTTKEISLAQVGNRNGNVHSSATTCILYVSNLTPLFPYLDVNSLVRHVYYHLPKHILCQLASPPIHLG